MTEKEQLIADAKGLGLELKGDETIAELKALIDTAEKAKDDQDAKATGPAGVTRRRVSRGSTRRIAAALSKFDKAFLEFNKELDLQFYEADDKGDRVAPWPFVKDLQNIRLRITEVVNEALCPPTDDKAE